ncbi:MAG TPA: hypothetical protein GX401_00370 [Clostridiales bacterium]|nr:hypothetical protein [Clostridiales bacterium]
MKDIKGLITDSTIIIGIGANSKQSAVFAKAIKTIASANNKTVANTVGVDICNGTQPWDIVIINEEDLPPLCNTKLSFLVCFDGFFYNSSQDKGYNNMIAPAGDSASTYSSFINSGGRLFTFSTKDDSADLLAKNIMEHNGQTHFELLGATSISRVMISKSCGFSVDELLAMAGVLLLVGIPFTDVIKGINAL